MAKKLSEYERKRTSARPPSRPRQGDLYAPLLSQKQELPELSV